MINLEIFPNINKKAETLWNTLIWRENWVTSIAIATMTSFGVNDLFVVNGLGLAKKVPIWTKNTQFQNKTMTYQYRLKL